MDYREILRAEFQKRRNENPFYSLRNLAKDLDLTVQHLSRLFKGQKGLSKKRASDVADRLGLNYKQTRLFQALVSSQSGRGWVERGFGRMYLRKVEGSAASVDLQKKSAHQLLPLPPIIKKHRARDW